jgi:hypothetical protein
MIVDIVEQEGVREEWVRVQGLSVSSYGPGAIRML